MTFFYARPEFMTGLMKYFAKANIQEDEEPSGRLASYIYYYYTILYNEKYFLDNHFSYVVRVLTWRV